MARDLVVCLTPSRDMHAASIEPCLDVYRDMGLRTRLITLDDPQLDAEFRPLLASNEIRFVIGISGHFAKLGVTDSDPVPIWDKLQIPFLAYYKDADFYYRPSPFMRSDFVRKCYPFQGLMDVKRGIDVDEAYSFLVHPSLAPNPYCDDVPWGDRAVLGVFAKNVTRTIDPVAYISAQPKRVADIFWNSAATLGSDTFADLKPTVDRQFADAGIEFPGRKPGLYYFMLLLVDKHVRDGHAIKLAKALARFPVVLVGCDWSFIDRSNARATFRDPISPDAMLRLFSTSKYVFNTNAPMQEWFHERVPIGFMSKCNVVSFTNRFAERHFAPFETFTALGQADDLDARLDAILTAADARDRAREVACTTTRERYDARKHAEELLEIASIDLDTIKQVAGASP